jgi:hypothetical protein
MNADADMEIIRALADGVNPITGEVFEDDSVYQKPQVIRALFTAMSALEDQEKRDKRQRKLPSKAGTTWTTEEDEKLSQAFDQGISIKELVKIHERTRGAIQSRLANLGKLAPPIYSRKHT